jgi:radical SAM protein with 4Fe4S-binding SPASM domain
VTEDNLTGECTQIPALQLERSNEEYLQAFNQKVVQRRIPLNGTIDLTYRCNLGCIHCYVGKQKVSQRNLNNELNTRQWRELIDEITDAGCLYLLITGGEPLLRKDFKEIYSHARTNGLLVTVFTNGTLITETILKGFHEFPPRVVEISLYGATRETYEKITRVSGSYEQCLNGISRLIEGQINVRLKTMLMKPNQHEFFAMENMAKEYGIKFRFDAALFPGLEGDKTPVRLRVSAKEAVVKEFSDNNRRQEWKDFFERMRNLPFSDALYQCGAGKTHFHIDPFGTLQPCLMVKDPNLSYNLIGGSFITGWDEVISRIKEKKAEVNYYCNQCQKRSLCGFCPGFFQLENGSEEACSQYLCAMGHLRFAMINDK